jgi:hypothetical protein
VPVARRWLDVQLDVNDSMPTVTVGASGGGGSRGQRVITIKDENGNKDGDPVPVTGVEQAALIRIDIPDHFGDWLDRLDATVSVLRALTRDVRHVVKDLAPKVRVPRCSASGREGAIEWARPDCWDAPIRGPLCAACYHRERRWRQEHGLPTRDAP